MKVWLLPLVLLVVALAQGYLLPYFPVFGVRVELMLVCLVAWSMVRGLDEAMVYVPLGGAFQSLLSGEPFGLAILALAPIVLLVSVRELRLLESELMLTLGVTLASTIAYHLIYVVALQMLGRPAGWTEGQLQMTVTATAVNLALALPALWAVRLASVDVRAAAAGGLTFVTGVRRLRGR